MSNNQKLFKDAIADAKALREVAIANAKAALEESFSPRIQSMFEKRIMEAEELDEEEELDEKVTYQGDKDNLIDPLDETMDSDDSMEEGEDIDLEELFNSLSEEDMTDEGMNTDDMYEEDTVDEEYDLDQILAELEKESLEENEEEMEEGKEKDEDLNENTMFEKASNDEEIKDVTVEELRDLIRDAIKAAMGDAEIDSEEDSKDEMDIDIDGEEDGDEDFDLDIDAEDETEEKSKKDELDEIRALYEKKKGEIKKELDERKRYKMNPKKSLGEGNNKDIDEAKDKELEEAINVIKALRSQLNEVNLLNAKLIYVNKIFRANNLNESQKVKVVNSFDKAQTLNETKNIYEVLKDTVKTSFKPKTQLRESKQFASNVIGSTSAKQPIIESNDVITRMQKLAGII
jgi:hypothetical protein